MSAGLQKKLCFCSFLCFVYRMLGRRDEDSSVAMIDVDYRQNRSGRKLVLVLQNLYLCASVEFLLAVADFFIQAIPKMPSTKVDKTNKHQVKKLSDATYAAHNRPGKKITFGESHKPCDLSSVCHP